jgi:transglutaminase-like putative cysteine protease
MQYTIHHTTEYIYEESVGFTPHLIRLFPRLDDRIRLSEYKLSVFPAGSVYWLKDPYDNAIAKFFSTEKSHQLSVTISARIEHRQESAFDFLLDNHAVKFPFSYNDRERVPLLPFLDPHADTDRIDKWLAPAQLELTGDTPTCLTTLVRHLHTSIRYQRRDEPGTQTATETMESGSGTCRDYAVLFMDVCTRFNLAVRYVSGYLYASADGDEMLGADSLHAWVDVYLPGAGWRGLDPTNGIWCGNCHIPLAVSKIPDETTPIEGNYCADHVVSSQMKSQLNIQNPSCIASNK